MHEFDLVVLTHPVPDYGLQQGDVGTIVHIYRGTQAYEVEFVTAQGITLAVLTLAQEAVRPFASREILHVRDLAA